MQSEEERITRLRTLAPRLIVLAWLPTCFFFGLVNRKVLPEKYFGDDAHIQDKMASEGVPTLSAPRLDKSAADSFEVMAWIYRTVGAQGHATIVQAVTMLAFFALLFACAGWADIGRFSMYETGVFSFSAVACAVYLAQYSKESLVLLLVAVLVLLPRNSLFDIAFILLCCTYAYAIRQYWFLVAGLFVIIRLALATRRAIVVPIVVAASLLTFAFATDTILGSDLNSWREGVAQSRVNSQDAQSAIQDYLPTDTPELAAANAAVTLLFLALPIPLLQDPSVVYVGFAVMTASMWFLLGTITSRAARLGWFVQDHRLARGTALLVAMVTVQAVFEPDYGSYVKHIAPLLPLFVLVFAARRRCAAADGLPRQTRSLRAEPAQRLRALLPG